MTNIYSEPLLTWENFIVFVLCALFICISLNFRFWVIFHLPSRKRDRQFKKCKR